MGSSLDALGGVAQSVSMSRIIALVVVALLATSLSSCGRKAPLDTPPPPGNQDQSQVG